MSMSTDNSRTVKTISRIVYILAFLAFLILAFIFSKYDLQISLAVYNPNSVIWNTFEIFGETPAIFIAVFSLNVLLIDKIYLVKSNRNKKINQANTNLLSIKRKVLIFIFCAFYIIISIGAFVYVFDTMHKYAYGYGMNKTVTFLLSILLESVFYYTTSLFMRHKFGLQIGNKHIGEFTVTPSYSKFIDNCRIVALTCVLTLLVVFIMKIFWGRIRFRNLMKDNSDFTPFYLPNGLISAFPTLWDTNTSFPSGHVANAACVYSLYIFCDKPRNRLFVRILLIIWILIIAISRVYNGAHYASDVLFGLAITLMLFHLSSHVIKKRSGRVNTQIKM
ncbi:MAG: phosphatase PAP2 family protein [Oscillospiraceae bacterium]|nr:phosphatase PAP2 family protein [Oscillospiraceae bacterium]